MEIEYSGEDYQNEISSPKQANLLSKTKLGKKTVLKPNKKVIKEENNIINQEDEVEKDAVNKEIIIIKNDIPNMNIQKENKATFLIKTIIKAFYLSTWKRKIKSMKYLSRGYNPKRLNFRKFINSISSAIKQHKYEYLNEILLNMDNLPMPNNVEHDYNYGTLRIVDREILSKKCSDKILIWAENNYSNKIKDIKNYLIEAFIKLKETNDLIGQINQNRETDYSNYEKYNPNSDLIDKKNDQNIIGYKTDDSRENNKFNYNKENVDININKDDENIKINNDKSHEKYFNDYNKNNIDNILPQNHNQDYYRNYFNISYNNELIDVGEPKRINEKDEYEINNNYLDDNYDYVEEEYYNNYNMNNNNYIQNMGNFNDNYNEKINNNNYIEENNFSNNNYINDNNYIQNINTNNYVEENNFVEDNKYIGNNYNGVDEKNNYFVNESIDLKENDYNNNDFIENDNTESEFNLENNYKYKDDKEYDYNNNDYIENTNQYQYKEENNYREDKYVGNNYFKEDEYDNNYAINNYNNYDKNNLIIPFEEEDNNNYKNINIPYEVENNNNNFKILYEEDNNNYNNYETQEYNKNSYNNYMIESQYNINNYRYEDNYNNYSNEEYDNDYNNEEYVCEEDYYYEEPNKQNINNGVTYYLPYNSQNQNGFRYITREGNNTLISDVYTKPKTANDRSKISIYNFNNSGRNKEYNYINYQYKIHNIGSNSSYEVKKHKRPFPTRDDNHSFYISK